MGFFFSSTRSLPERLDVRERVISPASFFLPNWADEGCSVGKPRGMCASPRGSILLWWCDQTRIAINAEETESRHILLVVRHVQQYEGCCRFGYIMCFPFEEQGNALSRYLAQRFLYASMFDFCRHQSSKCACWKM